MTSPVPVYVLMGTCGCGKTTIGQQLSHHFSCAYIEGDLLHPKANVDKMAAGVPLTDEDRWGWLASIREAYVENARQLSDKPKGKSRLILVTCSSLRKAYRDLLRDVPNSVCRVVFVYLKGSYELIESRMNLRLNHFMGSKMLESQWKTLEEPNPQYEEVIVQDISAQTDAIVENLVQTISKQLNL